MQETLILNQDALVAAEASGALVLDALPALRAAEPGALLNADLHMTKKGHRALASAISKVLTAPEPLARSKGGLPRGRSRVPSPEQLLVEASVKGSSAALCETYYRGGWFWLFAYPTRTTSPSDLSSERGPMGRPSKQSASNHPPLGSKRRQGEKRLIFRS
jgi:hypothetical protein